VVDVAVRRTADLDPHELRDLRVLLDASFTDFTEDDWDHGLGGWHAIVRADATMVAHAAVVPRTLVAGERTLAAGYVENVATRPGHRQRGHGRRAMDAIGPIITESYEIGALATGSHRFYASLGWESWKGPTHVRTPDGRRRRTPDDDDAVMVLRTERSRDIDLGAPLTCEWRAGDVW
jgi:aminoglycoside 2'-N-acetyltransferase I